MYSSMKLFVLVTFLLAFPFPDLKAQKTFKGIRSKIQSADSFWIISHEVTGLFIKNENGKFSEVILVENGKLHRELISKSILLDADGKSQLVKILARSSTSSKVEMAKCFFGAHAIVWKKVKSFLVSILPFPVIVLEKHQMLKIAFLNLKIINGEN